jgi:hypothetical protein
MAEFRTLDLGQVIQTAEAIKGMKRQENTDKLRDLYIGGQIEGQKRDQQTAVAQQAAQAQQLDWKRVGSAAASVEASTSPKSFAAQQFPQFVQEWEQEHGAGTWEQLNDDQVRQLAAGYKAHALAQLGEMPKVPDAENFGQPQEIVQDGKPIVAQFGNRGTIRPIEGGAPYNKPRGPGMSVNLPDGTSVTMGGDGVPDYGGVGLTKPNQTKIQEAFVNAQANAYALREQMAKYRPEFSQLSGRLKAGAAGLKDFVGMENAPQQQQFLSDFTTWKADTARLLSSYLNQLSGAAISPHEETRLKAGFPNSDDGPTEYQAKAQATMRSFALAQARAAYLLSNPSQSLDSVSLDNMSGIIVDEANKLAAAMQKGGMDEAQAKQRAIADTRARYGMQ